MKFAVLTESAVDDGSVRILVDAMFAGPIVWHQSPPSYKSREWPGVLSVLPVAIRALHYNSDVEGLLIVVDGNGTPVHVPETRCDRDPKHGCRWCQVRECIDQACAKLKPRSHARPLRIAHALTYPSIEAWFRLGRDPGRGESSWVLYRRSLTHAQITDHKRKLKRAIYNVVDPAFELSKRRQIEEAKNLAANLAEFEKLFPIGFGLFASEIRGWASPTIGNTFAPAGKRDDGGEPSECG